VIRAIQSDVPTGGVTPPERGIVANVYSEFYRDGIKVSGQGIGTPGSWFDLGNTFDKALDGDLETFFDALIPTGAYFGIASP
jgi:hypothetical protein